MDDTDRGGKREEERMLLRWLPMGDADERERRREGDGVVI